MTTRAPRLGWILAGVALLGGCGVIGGGGGGGGGGGDVDMMALDMAPGVVQPKFSSLYGDYFSTCGSCHAPSAPGRTSDIEKTLDFTSRDTAHRTITTGSTAGLVGNQSACNGVPFITAGTPGKSLIVAVVDTPTRTAFDLPATPACDVTAISDETVKVGSSPTAAFVSALKQWITNGALND